MFVVAGMCTVFFSGGHAYAKSLDQPWWQYQVTWSHSDGDTGEDLGTPVGTPITSLCAGDIVGAGFYAGGGVVTVRCPSVGDVYVQHLDSIVSWISHCENGPCGQSVSYGTLLGYSGGDCNSYWFGNPCWSGFSNGPHTEVGINPPWYGIWGPAHPGGNYDPYSFVASGGNRVPDNNSSVQSTGTGSGGAQVNDSNTISKACPYVLGDYAPGSGFVDCRGMFVVGPTGACPCNSLTLIEGITGQGDLYHYRGNEEIIYKTARAHGVKVDFAKYVYTGEKIYIPT